MRWKSYAPRHVAAVATVTAIDAGRTGLILLSAYAEAATWHYAERVRIAPSLPPVLLITGVVAWIGICLTTAFTAVRSPWLVLWGFASVMFITCFIRNARAAVMLPLSIAFQGVGVITMVALFCNGYEGFLLVLVAAQLALRFENRVGFAWIALQTAALAVAIAMHWTPGASLLLTPPYLGFQVLTFVAVRLFVEERHVTSKLSEVNETLQRLQGELAHKVRLEERLRIAQDMHDVFGHHVTALSLNLELASHEAQGGVRTTIRAAQSLARELLHDLKTMVRSVDDDAPVDLQREVHQLARDLPRPKLHVACPQDLSITDARASRALFRVIQEVVTNAIRHGAAQNLWITIERDAQRVTVVARDDGEAATHAADGFGLSGMRRRLEQLGGTLRAAPSTLGGFEVRAELPNGPG